VTINILDHAAPRTHLNFTLSGDSIITLHSLRTGRRFTYRILKAPLAHTSLYYIDLLNGTHSDDTFYPLGRIESMNYIYSHHSPILSDHESNLAFTFFWHNLLFGRIHPDLEIIHVQNRQHT